MADITRDDVRVEKENPSWADYYAGDVYRPVSDAEFDRIARAEGYVHKTHVEHPDVSVEWDAAGRLVLLYPETGRVVAVDLPSLLAERLGVDVDDLREAIEMAHITDSDGDCLRRAAHALLAVLDGEEPS